MIKKEKLNTCELCKKEKQGVKLRTYYNFITNKSTKIMMCSDCEEELELEL